jgi:molybdopterin synthase catalytic subunit
MLIRTRLFASLKDTIGSGWVESNLGPGATVRDLLDELASSHPRARTALEKAMVAVNLEYVGPDFRLSQDDEVALIPPVSGGSQR